LFSGSLASATGAAFSSRSADLFLIDLLVDFLVDAFASSAALLPTVLLLVEALFRGAGVLSRSAAEFLVDVLLDVRFFLDLLIGMGLRSFFIVYDSLLRCAAAATIAREIRCLPATGLRF
jgi:hypothetical protein